MKKFLAYVFAFSTYTFAADMPAEFRLQSGAVKQGIIKSYSADSVTVLGQFGGVEQVKVFARTMFTSIVLADGTFLGNEAPLEPAQAGDFVPESTPDTLAENVEDSTQAVSEPLPLNPEPTPEPEPVIAKNVLPELPPIPGLRTTQKIAIGLWGASAASLGTGVVFNVLSNRDIEDFNEAVEREDDRSAETAISSQNDHIRGRNISYGISLGSLIAGAIFWFL